jgi:SAM-dependent methyltransferase
LGLCPPQGLVLDAACGTGKYWPLILASGRTVFGIDQSQGMLARAHEKFPDVPIEKVGLQEMRYQEAFDGAICMDALEMVCPEEWPLVLSNLCGAIQPKAYAYFTVETAVEQDIENAFAECRRLGLPVVYGEWVQGAQFTLIEDTFGEEYHHFLVQKYQCS